MKQIVHFGCLCGTQGQVDVADNGVPVYAECAGESECGFVWRITRTRTNRGVALSIRPSKSGRKPVEFSDDTGKTIRIAPGTLFPEE